jgi:hypothetical protein
MDNNNVSPMERAFSGCVIALNGLFAFMLVRNIHYLFLHPLGIIWEFGPFPAFLGLLDYVVITWNRTQLPLP